MDDPSPVTVVVEPWCAGSSSESLDAAKGRVLTRSLVIVQ